LPAINAVSNTCGTNQSTAPHVLTTSKTSPQTASQATNDSRFSAFYPGKNVEISSFDYILGHRQLHSTWFSSSSAFMPEARSTHATNPSPNSASIRNRPDPETVSKPNSFHAPIFSLHHVQSNLPRMRPKMVVDIAVVNGSPHTWRPQARVSPQAALVPRAIDTTTRLLTSALISPCLNSSLALSRQSLSGSSYHQPCPSSRQEFNDNFSDIASTTQTSWTNPTCYLRCYTACYKLAFNLMHHAQAGCIRGLSN